MIETAGTQRDRALIGLLWESGVRIHELLALDLGDVREGEMPENGGRKLYALWFKKAKVPGEEHVGYVIEAAPLLAAWVKSHPFPRADAPLFPKASGGRLSPDGAAEVVKRTAMKAGIGRRVWCHLFRHSRATYLLNVGMKEIDVKRLLGWAPGSPLLELKYAHLSTGAVKASYLKALGLQSPERIDLGKLSFPDEGLSPVVPLNPPPGKALSVVPQDEIEELLADPKVARFLALLQAAKGA
jgi:integrase